MSISLKTRLRRIASVLCSPFELVGENLKGMLVFEAVYRILVYFVFFPLLTWIYRMLLVVNGTNTIAAFNFRAMRRNPLTWVVLLLLAVLMTVFAVFERFAIIDTLHASHFCIHRKAREIFRTGFSLTVQSFRPRNALMILYCLVILHFGSVTDISGITSFIRLPGFLLEDIQKHPWEQIPYYLVLFTSFYLNIRWILAIPVMMDEDSPSFFTSCKKSARMTKGVYTLQLIALTIVWIALLALLSAALSLVLVVGWFLISLWLQPGQTQPFLVFVSDHYLWTEMACGFFTTWLLTPMVLASIQSFYYRRKEAMGLEIYPYTEEKDYIGTYPVLRIGLILVCAVCIFFSGPRRFAQIKWILNTDMGTPLIMAHRGYSAKAPENTLPAFQLAIDEGITAAELDVQMTKDGEIVVLHDSNLKRVTGLDKNIWDVTWDEIKDLDAGSHFSKKYAGTTIPTLDEVLKLCKDKLYLNIEIKRTGHDDGIAEKVIDLIAENDYIDNCDITSQNYATLEEVRAINPDILTCYTSVIGIGRIHMLEAADIISIMETFATYENIEAIQSAGKRTFVWTVNDEDAMEDLVNLNVDAILTNDPLVCKKVVDNHESSAVNLISRLTNALSFL